MPWLQAQTTQERMKSTYLEDPKYTIYCWVSSTIYTLISVHINVQQLPVQYRRQQNQQGGPWIDTRHREEL